MIIVQVKLSEKRKNYDNHPQSKKQLQKAYSCHLKLFSFLETPKELMTF